AALAEKMAAQMTVIDDDSFFISRIAPPRRPRGAWARAQTNPRERILHAAVRLHHTSAGRKHCAESKEFRRSRIGREKHRVRRRGPARERRGPRRRRYCTMTGRPVTGLS